MIDCQIVILAAGSSKRMGSPLPKVMHEIAGKPMIEWVINNAKAVTDDIILVTSPKLTPYLNEYQGIKFVTQEHPKGTAHAVFVALSKLSLTKPIAVLYGDNPLISAEIITDLITHLDNTDSAITTLAFDTNTPAEYGRIVLDENDKFVKIIEFKNANEEQRKITLCNSGVTAFGTGKLQQYLPICLAKTKSENQEYYLTELVELGANLNEPVGYMLCRENQRVIGVNTKSELENVIKYFARFF